MTEYDQNFFLQINEDSLNPGKMIDEVNRTEGHLQTTEDDLQTTEDDLQTMEDDLQTTEDDPPSN